MTARPVPKMPATPPPPPQYNRAPGRIILTLVLLAGFGGGFWALSQGKRLAERRKARFAPPAQTAPAQAAPPPTQPR